MRLRHNVDVISQLFNVIFVTASVVALLTAYQYSTTVVQTTTLTEAQPSTITATVTVTTTQQANSTSSTCSPGHCSFTRALSVTISPIPNLSGEVHHTTTVLNPAALAYYEFFNNLGTVLGFFGVVLSVWNFRAWWKQRHKPKPIS
jgi:hypothetical protein